MQKEMVPVKLTIITMLLLVSLPANYSCKQEYSRRRLPEPDETSPCDSCPVWTTCVNNTCKCGSTLNGAVKCDKQLSVSIPNCYCISYNEAFNTTVIGNCLYGCDDHAWVKSSGLCRFRHTVYSSNKSSVEERNHDMCRKLKMNRTGQMCGQCEDGYALSAYSHRLDCIKCSDYKYNWLKYIAVAFLPLTLFYFVIIVFRVSASSGILNVYIFVCQICTAPGVFWIVLYSHISKSLQKYSGTVDSVSILTSIHAIWNLDFFNWLYKPFCLHPKATILHLLALRYTEALFPLLLIIITYIFVSLHDRYSLVVRLWRPFYRCFIIIRTEWNIKTSLIGAFGTFLLLSSLKFLNISLVLLSPVTLTDVNGTTLKTQYLYVDGSIEFLGETHWPFAVLALVMLTIFNVIPFLLLCLYPCRSFHKCLNKCRLHSQLIHTFMDTFQGSYKTEPRDYRHFEAVFYLLRIFNVAFPAFFFNARPMLLPVTGVLLVGLSILTAILKPYRQPTHNWVNPLLLLWCALTCFSYPIYVYTAVLNRVSIHAYRLVFIGSPAVILVLFDIGYLIYGLVPTRVVHFIAKVIKRCRPECANRDTERVLPYRLEHMDEYTPINTARTTCNYWTLS